MRFAAAAYQFVGEPLRRHSFALLLFRLTQLLHERANGRLDGAILRLARWLRPKGALPPSRLLDDNKIAAAVVGLRERGWHILPHRLAAEDIAEIRRFAFATPAHYGEFEGRELLDEHMTRAPHPRYEWLIRDILHIPAVQRLLGDSALHHIAQEHIGCRPILTSIALWLDPVYDGEYAAHVYHYDNDGPAFLKFFIYLTDVDEASGAHTYIEGSHDHVKPAAIAMSRRYGRDELLAHYGYDSERIFVAPAGTILAEDTAGFHRGMNPTIRYRLLLQLQYSAVDIPHAEEFACGCPRVNLPLVDGTIRRIVRKFLA